MATPSRQLIDLLLRTAEDIETNPNYNWYRTEDCNCGILAKNAGCPIDIDGQLIEEGDDWGYITAQTCAQTGLPLVEAVKVLLSYGLTTKDIVCLEDCNDRDVLGLMPNRSHINKCNSAFVAQYLRAWASMLDRQLLEQACQKAPLSECKQKVMA